MSILNTEYTHERCKPSYSTVHTSSCSTHYNPYNPRANIKNNNVQSPCMGCKDRCIKSISVTETNGETHSKLIRCHDTCEKYIAYDKEITRRRLTKQSNDFDYSLSFIHPKNRHFSPLYIPTQKRWYENEENATHNAIHNVITSSEK